MRFNRGLSLIYMVRCFVTVFTERHCLTQSSQGCVEEGMRDLEQAKGDKQSSEHDVIDEACHDQAVVRWKHLPY